MANRLDYELRALEADSQAETAHRVSIAHGWRDIARGYRMLADFIADEQAARQSGDDLADSFGQRPATDLMRVEECQRVVSRNQALDREDFGASLRSMPAACSSHLRHAREGEFFATRRPDVDRFMCGLRTPSATARAGIGLVVLLMFCGLLLGFCEQISLLHTGT